MMLVPRTSVLSDSSMCCVVGGQSTARCAKFRRATSAARVPRARANRKNAARGVGRSGCKVNFRAEWEVNRARNYPDFQYKLAPVRAAAEIAFAARACVVVIRCVPGAGNTRLPGATGTSFVLVTRGRWR